MDEEKSEELMENPLVVHKKSDTSYKETVDNYVMDETHTDDDGPTLERHRFRKDPDKKSKKTPMLILIILVIVAAVIAALYLNGNFGGNGYGTKKTTTTTTTAVSVTTLQEAYKDTIVVKNTYIFVDGEEVDGIEGLMSELKYETPSTTRYTIINENAEASFFNDNVLPILVQLGFYDEKTVITHKNLTGLTAKEEQTKVSTTKKKRSKKKKKKTTVTSSELSTQSVGEKQSKAV